MDLTLAEQHFHISTKGSDNPLLSFAAAELLQPEPMKELLQKGSLLIKGIGLELAVSFVGLAFFGLAATKQVMMSQYNRILDLSLDNLTIQLESHGDHAHVVFKINELKWTDLPLDDRESAIRTEWSKYFADTMNPLIEAAAGAAGLKSAMIWNQYGARIAYLMDYLRQIVPDGPLRELIESDYKLLAGMPGETFDRRKNPFDYTPCYLDSPYKPGTQMILRSACCMYYKREEGVKCYNCPILKDEERAAFRLKIEAARQDHSA
ncbi:IucA/IucC family C-terminal-domain containing protein [Cohnella silvisoli]|uniref:IucA/IucC family C-terminal-domain containing protein n=1 Tax=Cohnella silvisoli TaxID=2873699 RepID=A0ABV1KMM4_9BACL|nr:(2Fe-2S)-binding protein [Cohnella silvisoli]MCD9020468.1 (2Fe-2S)-binding protein [Cohnella silvisoli]